MQGLPVLETTPQTPLEQIAMPHVVPGHVTPQPPQLLGSDETSMQVPAQSRAPPSQAQRLRPVLSLPRQVPEQQSAFFRQTPPPLRQAARADPVDAIIAPAAAPIEPRRLRRVSPRPRDRAN